MAIDKIAMTSLLRNVLVLAVLVFVAGLAVVMAAFAMLGPFHW